MKTVVITPDQFDLQVITGRDFVKRKRGNPGQRNPRKYKHIISAFDIETSGDPDTKQSWMYVWQWQIEQYTIVGRTWQEWLDLAERINGCYQDGEYLVVFVHNLSYEFQFLSGVVRFEPENVFALDAHKVLRADWQHIEFRCSALHSNRTLKQYLKDMNAEHQKLDGDEFNYHELRFPDTPLTNQELQYCINDVCGLCEAVSTDMLSTGDSLYTFPLTSTGYVRRDAKKCFEFFDRRATKGIMPDLGTYHQLRRAFIGGNTHANRYYSGTIVEDCRSVDRSSSYPDVICNCPFPVSPFELAPKLSGVDEILHYMDVRKRACLITFTCTDLRLRDEHRTPCPYLMRHKVEGESFRLDNGRVLSAAWIRTTVTDIDFRIIISQYDWKGFRVDALRYAKYGQLPECYTDLVKSYYAAKTQLKGVHGKELEYARKKALLNSLYGMMAQVPVKQSIIFDPDLCEWFEDNKTEEELLLQYNRRAFLPYQWGVWVTAWARQRLQLAIDAVGDDFLYCDTDSVKYLGQHDFSTLNTDIIKQSKSTNSFARDPAGQVHYMGVFESEDHMKRFITLGAKRYAYEDDSGKLHLTVAGVSKKIGAGYLASHGGLEAFNEGFIFENAGKLEATYNVMPLHFEEYKGHRFLMGNNVYLGEVSYTITYSDDYAALLNIIKYGNIDTSSD